VAADSCMGVCECVSVCEAKTHDGLLDCDMEDCLVQL